MKPVDQTTFGVPAGNCFSACIASLLEVDIAEVPYFMDEKDWVAKLNRWLAPRGLYATCFSYTPEDIKLWQPGGYCILGGQSSRGSHAVVGRGREVVHDPHPSREGLLQIEDCTLLVPIDPSTVRPC